MDKTEFNDVLEDLWDRVPSKQDWLNRRPNPQGILSKWQEALAPIDAIDAKTAVYQMAKSGELSTLWDELPHRLADRAKSIGAARSARGSGSGLPRGTFLKPDFDPKSFEYYDDPRPMAEILAEMTGGEPMLKKP